MIVRAILAFVFVLLAWPHEPDMGLGRPALFSQISSLEQARSAMLDGLERARRDIRTARGDR